VLVLERGRHVEPAEFSENEVEQFSALYRDGAFQLARDFRLQVLQGMCVGGTTVINNAVCIDPGPETLERWRAVGVDTEDLKAGIGRARTLLNIQPQPHDMPPLQPGARKFVDGVKALGLEEQARRYGTVEANINDCLGCGYCNIGCRFGKKLSALDTLLPWAQRDFGDRLRVLAECEAERIETANGRATGVRCRLSDGRRVTVSGERIVVAAGAINSSYLLGRSGIGGAAAGRGLCFNVGSPMTAEFDEELNSFDGLQITHLFEPAGEPRFVMETWFNPVVSQALTMPGWFEDHRRNMANYTRMTATGVLVGTESNGRVTKALFGGADIVWKPTAGDLAKLVEGLKLVGRIYLAAGARRVMPSTFQFHSFSREAELDQLDWIVRDGSDIQLGTGHPQGGNGLNASPDLGVVDPETFRVHGKDNLYLCDASAFPTSLTVNPQLTVLGLAECAAARIVDE
jgi:choline dehydrogenase-like flavoprotein